MSSLLAPSEQLCLTGNSGLNEIFGGGLRHHSLGEAIASFKFLAGAELQTDAQKVTGSLVSRGSEKVFPRGQTSMGNPASTLCGITRRIAP